MPKYLLPHKFSSRLVLLDELPSGASGYVYKAQYQRNTQPIDVVVKFFDHPPSHEMFGYFTNEQVVLRGLNETYSHPHLVEYVTHDLTQQPFYLMTRYVPDAKSLSKLKAGDIHPSLLIRIAEQVGNALDYLHEGKHLYKPVIHRDVKPDNILLDTDYNAVLIDLSIAQHPHFTITDEKVMGTPMYMPPEQYEGAEVPASDQFSLAAVIYELLTGQPLLSKQPLKAYQHIKELRDSGYAKVTQTLGSSYSHTSSVLIQALSYDPEHRFVTCTAFANSLQAALEKDGKSVNQPIVIRHQNQCSS
ncbi:serine/threonine protein kinase [bacterium]|nr:serine/threonine protein kinase [bacterium]